MTANLNRPAIHPGKLTAADLDRHVYQTTQPAEAATEVGLDLDGDGDLYHPAPAVVLWRALGVLALVMAFVACAVFARELAELGAWLLGAQ